MALEPAPKSLEPKLPAIGARCAQIKPCDAKPACNDVLAPVSGLEDAKRFWGELLTFVLGYGQKVILDLAQTIAAKARGADLGPRPFALVAGRKGNVNCG